MGYLSALRLIAAALHSDAGECRIEATAHAPRTSYHALTYQGHARATCGRHRAGAPQSLLKSNPEREYTNRKSNLHELIARLHDD